MVTQLQYRLMLCVLSVLLCLGSTVGQTPTPHASPSKSISADDGGPEMSGVPDSDPGFLPVVLPISEPAVGYGVVVVPAFIRRPAAGDRPNITALGGFATENESWGAVAADSRHWLGGRLQTLAGALYASVNLDYYGIGKTSALANQPLAFNLEPKGFVLQSKYRLGTSHWWAGLGYAFVSTDVSFDAPAGTPHLPDFRSTSNVGGLGPSVSFDTRNNIFTPTRGTYLEAGAGFASEALGGDAEFQRVQWLAMHYLPLHPKLTLGLRGQLTAAFGDTPFYMEPFILMRGVAAMRYQGDEVAQVEAEVRWQFWRRFSLVGFVGGGAAWTEFDAFDNTQTAAAGGAGFRYELARRYGIHAGVDVAWGPDDPTMYITIGSAWMRP
ncbi:MAG TPA: BamA/TamA family outer membrane protein [Verrucomicrobiota bacterium]|nr:BamA/TamA family outer membrane protein [Verrucomicrobiota bacterium]HNU52517.1 BamA/TamA family outer membrane protein [Verrucomicrobiota bacterium]